MVAPRQLARCVVGSIEALQAMALFLLGQGVGYRIDGFPAGKGG